MSEDEEEKITAAPKLEPVFSEYVVLGGYQHLLYKQLLPNSKELTIKIHAKNVNPKTEIA